MSPAAVTLAASDTGKGSPIGLFVILLLLIAVYLLYRSMSGRLRRLPERFPGYGTAGTDGAGADGITTAAAADTSTGDSTAHPGSDGTRIDGARMDGPLDVAGPNGPAGLNDDLGADDPGRNSGDKRR